MLSRRLKLGRFLGIGLYVHWSFALLIAYVILSARSEGTAVIAFSVSMLFGTFLCVTLHEYGHAMAARAFGIGTADITLLPIGGVARLHRMPRIPWQELIVAIAGPAVNVVIAIGLLTGFTIFLDRSVLSALVGFVTSGFSEQAVDEASLERINALFAVPSLAGYSMFLLIVNVMLVLFNMIPAFPMDGGRVFRSLMAMVLDYRKATWLASRVGLVCALLMVLLALGLDPTNPIPLLIAVFIGYAGISEARHVDVMESVSGVTVGQVMVHSRLSIPMDTPLSELVLHWRGFSATSLPVTSLVGTVVGMLPLRELSDAVEKGMDLSTPAGQLIDHESPVPTVRIDEPLQSVLMRVGKRQRQIPVVDDAGLLVGILDLDTMLIRKLLVGQDDPISPNEVLPRFDQIS